jgi:hypothetical protein
LTLLRPHSPADEIWRAVLAQDSEAMAHIDLTAGPVHLLIERDANGVQVRRLSAAAWQFTTALVAGTALYAALGEAALAEGDINALLAEHLAAGRFIDFSQTGAPAL